MLKKSLFHFNYQLDNHQDKQVTVVTIEVTTMMMIMMEIFVLQSNHKDDKENSCHYSIISRTQAGNLKYKKKKSDLQWLPYYHCPSQHGPRLEKLVLASFIIICLVPTARSTMWHRSPPSTWERIRKVFHVPFSLFLNRKCCFSTKHNYVSLSFSVNQCSYLIGCAYCDSFCSSAAVIRSNVEKFDGSTLKT